VFALIAYLVGNRVFSDYLQLNLVPGASELCVLCSALIGAGVGPEAGCAVPGRGEAVSLLPVSGGRGGWRSSGAGRRPPSSRQSRPWSRSSCRFVPRPLLYRTN
jgi:hypothetical protein